VLLYFLAASAGNAATNQFSLAELPYRYFSNVGSVAAGARFLLLITVLSGGTFPVALVLLWKTQSVSARVLAWLCALQIAAGTLFYPLQHVHYHLPLLMVLYVLGLCVMHWEMSSTRRWLTPTVAVTLGLVAIYLLPRTVSVSENARALGSVTRVECEADLPALYEAADGFEKLISWRRHGISMHNWIYYSLRPAARVDPEIIVADRASALPPGFREVSAGRRCRILVSAEFNPDDYLPGSTYRNEPGWRLLAVPAWRSHFPSPESDKGPP
jgi:hypothetical protein